ncbi:MAG: hypothetical protein MUO59_06560, partial [Actinobacteria bacterium]|nr:hypothetical protein [Actinomycetota bacterium]
MVNKYKMRHAKIGYAKKRVVNWKIIIIITSSLAVLAIAYVIYLYFPIIFKFIDNKVLSLFSGSSGIVVEEAGNDGNPGTPGQEDPGEETTGTGDDKEIIEEKKDSDEDNINIPTISLKI